MAQTNEQMQSLWLKLKELATLKYEYTKLTVAEKSTILLSMVALGFLAMLIGIIVVFFLSLGLSHWIAESIGYVWSSLIIAGAYLLVLLLLIAFRKQLLINPISKFITRLMH